MSSTEATLALVSALLFDDEALPSEVDASPLIPLLRAHRVPLAVLPRASALARGDASGAVEAYLQEERDRYERHVSAYGEIAAAWVLEGIEGVLIKSPRYLPYTSSNLDVLVPSTLAADACAVLERLGYRELRRAREPYKVLFRRVRHPHLGFPVHVHTAVAWITRFLTDAEVLDRRRRSDELESLVYPSPENVFSITTAHWLYEDKEIVLRDVYHASLAVHDGVDWDAVRRQSERSGWRDGLELALGLYRIAAERFAAPALRAALPAPELRSRVLVREVRRRSCPSPAPIRLSKSLCKGLQLAKTVEDASLGPRATVRELARALAFTARARFPSNRRGPRLSVAVSGADNAGKTTLARALEELLTDEIGLTASYHWVRLGSSPGLEAVKSAGVRLLGGAPGGGNGRPARSGERKALLGGRPLLREAWAAVLLADFLVRLWSRQARCSASGGIHVFDRHRLDAAVDLEAMYAFSKPGWAVALAPSPAVEILIATPAQEQRPEVSIEDAGDDRRGAELYRQYEQVADAVVAARDPLDRVLGRVAQVVIAAYVEGDGRVTP